MTEVIALVTGVFLGALLMSLASGDAYTKGALDERRRLWRAVFKRDDQ